MEPADIAKLAEGLAAVGIAALAVTHPVPAAALGAAIPFLRASWDRNETTRKLQRQVADAITAWATSEHLGDELATGMTIATLTLQKQGLSARDFKELDFDADRATAEVIRRAGRLGDPDWAGPPTWAEDDEHVVARKAIRATLSGLVAAGHSIEAIVLRAIREESGSLSQELARVALRVEVQGQDLRAVTQQLCASASVADLMIYLQRRIEDWDTAFWIGGRRPSQIERRLSATVRGQERDKMTVPEALKTFEHLVILGGPGAGKSWLARRTARESATSALGQLREGRHPREVEIPLLTTWDAWTRQMTGDARKTLVEASFGTGLGYHDLGGQATAERIKRLLAEAPRALVVIDSLDEAKDKTRLPERVHELEGIGRWRTVITSRHGAWDAKGATRQRTAGVAEIEPLAWESDVQPFIRSWFTTNSDRATALIQRLGRDTRLRQTATVPLLLTFYCMYAEDTQGASPLPSTRRELYDHVVGQLLRGDWTGEEPPARVTEAKRLLARWAWDAVKDAVTPSGLGDWGETFQPLEWPPPELERALDNVAPVSVDSAGRVSRQFRHRTLLEHLVAEHIASVKPNEATKVLLPHLWFDPDWEVALPAAIAAHPQRDALLKKLLRSARSHRQSPGTTIADEELDRRLLALAAESKPHDWGPSAREMLDRLRVQYAPTDPERVVRSSHWRQSNRAAVAGILAALPTAGPWVIDHLLGVLPGLAPTFEERRATLAGILAVLPTVDPIVADRLVGRLSGLAPTVEERRDALAAVLAVLPTAEPWVDLELVEVLPGLESTVEERREALAAVLAVLPTAEPWVDWKVAQVLPLPGLESTVEERREALAAVLAELTAESVTAACVVEGLRAWATTQEWLTWLRTKRTEH